jgi:hypothetical protein
MKLLSINKWNDLNDVFSPNPGMADSASHNWDYSGNANLMIFLC